MKNTLGGKKLIVGSGPNQFVGEWLMSKPSAVNQTIFWNTDFNYGVGLIPTFIVTTGLLGIIAWLIFFPRTRDQGFLYPYFYFLSLSRASVLGIQCFRRLFHPYFSRKVFLLIETR